VGLVALLAVAALVATVKSPEGLGHGSAFFRQSDEGISENVFA
jgi:hypothetical protein